MKYVILLLGHLLALPAIGQTSYSSANEVLINDLKLSASEIREITRIYGVAPVPGRYWYDTRSGAFGLAGGPVLGVMYPGHRYGELSSMASRGNSGVFINKRQLQSGEAIQLARIFGYNHPVPGWYWMNANGDIGVEGYPYAIGNVYLAIALAQPNQVSSATHNGNLWSSGLYSGGNYYTGANGQPSQGYVSVPGYGPVSHGMN
jgi:hypothetical protein